MKTIYTLLLIALTASTACADEIRPVDQKPLDASFLRLYAETRGFMLGRPVKPKPTPDGKAVLFLRSEAKKAKLSLFEFDVATGKTRELLTPETLLKGAGENLSAEEKARRERQRISVGGFTDYQLSEDGKKILLGLSGKLYVVDRDSATPRAAELATGKGTLLDPKFSPTESQVSYVLNQDVYVYDLTTNKETPVTKGGTEVKTNGLAEFVAQEEMSRYSGYWWSPDGKFIAYEEADHEGVEQWFVADPAKPGQTPLPQYYPRPGKKNVSVRLGIIPITGGETVWVEWDHKKFEYLAAVRWDKHGPLTIQVQDRKQQELVLLLVDPKTGKTKQLLAEKDPAFVNLRQDVPQWFPNKQTFVWISESDRAMMLETRDAERPTGRSFRLLTGIQQFISIDPRDSGLNFIMYDQPPGLTSLRRLSLREDFPKIVDVTAVAISADHSVRSMTITSSRAMPQTLISKDGVPDRVALPSVALEPEFTPNIDFPAEKTSDYYTAIIRPRDFEPKKKYPVIVDVYGGPHHLTVTQQMKPWLLMQWLADQGFIVVAIDNRGTPGRGRDWERAIYQKFDSVPLDDQIEGLKLLGEKHPEMDMERVGIVGWSFGGYMSALAVLKRPDVFKAAVAGAPVTDWEDYDTHYTERYLGVLPESQKAYDDANLVKMADKLTRPLLLLHGTADDNVYFRHTLKLTDALFRAGKDFEVLPLPSLTHQVPDPVVMERMWTRIAGHFQKHLGKAK